MRFKSLINNSRISILFICLIIFSSGYAQKLPDPSTLKGVHWKTYTVPVFNANGTLVSAEVIAKPDIGLTDSEKIELFASTGMNCIAYKLEDGGQMTADFPNSGGGDDKSTWNKLTTAEKNILDVARAEGAYRFAKAASEWNIANPDKPVYIILFTRKWFQSNGSFRTGNMYDAATIFNDVIKRCVANNCDQAIVGVHAVENRIDGIDDLPAYALQFAEVMNTNTNNWLKNKTLFFSGLGMGISFKGYKNKNNLTEASINNCKGSDTFWNDISKQCAAFCWSHKQYPKTDVEPSLTAYFEKYNVDWKNGSYNDVLGYLLDVCGHKDLKKFVDRAPSEMYNNVLYWGDASDGIRHLNNNVRDALKAIWISYDYQAASFYHFLNQKASEATAWNEQNDNYYVDKGILKINATYNLWQKFMDGNLNNPFKVGNKLDFTTALQSVETQNNFGIRQFQNQLYISNNSGNSFHIAIYNVNGKVVFSSKYNASDIHLPLTLNKGVFIVEISNFQARFATKIIVQ